MEDTSYASHITSGNPVRVFQGPYMSQQMPVMDRKYDELILYNNVYQQFVSFVLFFDANG